MATKKSNTKAAPKTTEKKTNQTAENTQAAEKPQYRVPFVSAKIDRLVDYEGSKVKAIARAVVGNPFAVHGFKVIENDSG